MTPQNLPRDIGTMRERSLHSALRDWYILPGDRYEAVVDGYLIDIVRGELLIEIQTRNFAALKHKLASLLKQHMVRIVHPISVKKWIVNLAADRKTLLGRRKSPKCGRIEDVFREFVSFPQLASDPHFSLEVVLIHEEEIRYRTHPRGRFRKAWSVLDRRLLEVIDRVVFQSPSDFCALIPSTLRSPFTTRDLANALHQSRALAQKMVYCLRGMGAIDIVGKRGNSRVYASATAQYKGI